MRPTRPPAGAADATVLIVDADGIGRSALAAALVARGYRVRMAGDPREALHRRSWESADALLVDLDLPDRGGPDTVRRLRRQTDAPIVVLCRRPDERLVTMALDLGADDFLVRPFSVADLDARLRTLLRHARPAPEASGSRYEVGGLSVDPGRREVSVLGIRVDLTPRESEILLVLIRQRGRVLTKGRILRLIGEEITAAESARVSVHVSQLRRKLAEADPAGRLDELIVTEPGIGYRLT